MSEMKPCPFCGSKALTNIFLDCEDIENLPTNVIDDYEPEVTCENERCIYGWWLSPKDWNTRPIEDALQAENKQIKEDLQHEKTRSQLNLEAEERRMLNITYYCAEIDRLNARIAELEHDLTNKEIEYTDLWDDALAFQARIAELEAYIDQLIEAGDGLVGDCELNWKHNHIPDCPPANHWQALVDDWKEG